MTYKTVLSFILRGSRPCLLAILCSGLWGCAAERAADADAATSEAGEAADDGGDGGVTPGGPGLTGGSEGDGGDEGGGDEGADESTFIQEPDGGTNGYDDGAEDDEGGSDTGTTGDPDMVCQDQEPVVMFLSPDDSNSISSPVQAREALQNGGYLGRTPIRTWEFLNYYTFPYPAAAPGQLTLSAAMVEVPEQPNNYTLQIGLGSEAIANDARAPLNITLVLDESGSMSGQPIEMLKATSNAIIGSLREGDILSIVTWDTSNAEVLSGHVVSGPDDATALAAIADISAGGGTDLSGGLQAGYALAETHRDPTRINRIVLISDGGANAGVTDEEVIGMHAGGNDEDGIYMVGVGVGRSGADYNDRLMDRVTDLGKGASVFIANEEDAQRTFGRDFVNTLSVAARDVRVRLDLPPGFEWVTFSGEERSSDPTEVRPQHIAPNDAMVFHQQLETCAPELIDDATEITITASFRDPVTFESRQATRTMTVAELRSQDLALLHKGAAVFAYAEALKAARGSATPEEDPAVAAAFRALALAEEALPDDAELAEIRALLETL